MSIEPKAGRAATALSTADIRERLRGLPYSMDMLQEIFARAPVGLQIYERSGHCILVNPMHTQMFGGVPPPHYNVFEDTVLIERGVADLVRRAFAGERIVVPPIWYDIRDLHNIEVTEGGRRFAVGAELVPLTPHGAPDVTHVLFVFNDVTEALDARERAEAAAAEARAASVRAQDAAARAAFLAEAGRVLAASLDYEQTLSRIAHLATPTLADFCIVDVLDADGSLRRVAAAHADPNGQPLLDELRRRYPPQRGSPQPAMRVLASGHPELLAEVDPEVIAQHTVDAEHAALMRSLGVRSHLAVPLTLGERIVGAISMAYVGVRRYAPDDVPLIEALASRAAVAIEHARLYRDAETARTEAQEANRAKDHFLAMLGHELRNPLAPIVTALRLMRLKPPGSTDGEQDMIERQVRHMARLVDDLMDVSRITQGKIELERAIVMVHDVVARALEMAGPLIEQRRHRLSVDIEPGLQVEGDEMRLAQVLSNLLTNAARYTDPGGAIHLSALRTAGGKLRLAVADTGSGIDPPLLARVFEPFVQGPRGPDRAGGGLGIGLALVKSLVQLHGGTVDATSGGPGKGSEFVVVLPSFS